MKTASITIRYLLPNMSNEEIVDLLNSKELNQRYNNSDDLDIRQTIAEVAELLRKRNVLNATIKMKGRVIHYNDHFTGQNLLDLICMDNLTKWLLSALEERKSYHRLEDDKNYIYIISDLMMALVYRDAIFVSKE